MENLEKLIEYFPTGTTEGERQILKRAFIQTEDFAEFIAPPPYSPRILVGKKGSGKSAIIDFSISLFTRTGVPSVSLKPLDIDITGFSEASAVGEITRKAYLELVKTIARVLGSTMTGFISNSDKTLYEQAVTNDMADRDIISTMSRLLPKLAKPYVAADLSSLLPEANVATRKALEKAISSNIQKSKKGFYLFIDDTDQLAIPDRPGHLNRIWGFLLAARELCQKIEQLRCVISLREEVWRRLTTDRAGQRDQTDHFATLVRYLNPSREHIERIIEKRLLLAKKDLAIADPDPWPLFFEGKMPKMPTTDKRSSWVDLIVVRSRERPRDAVQLINALAKRAIEHKEKKITESNFHSEIVEFSKQRVNMLGQEVEDECPQMIEIIRTFSILEYDYGSFKAKTETIRHHISGLSSQFSITLHGHSIHTDIEDEMLQLWRFLYELGILNARISDEREKDGYRHISARDDPNFVSKTRWNDMQAVVWEIDAAYRDHLICLHREQRARIGLPPTGRRS